MREEKINTRNKFYIVPQAFTKFGEKKLEYEIPKLFNALPMKLRYLTTFKEIKPILREYLLE